MKNEEFISKLKENQRKDLQTLKKKNDDYAQGDDPFQNFRMVEDTGLMSVEKGIAVRMSDKMQRIFNLIDKDASVEDEKIEDTLSDLRNYANILQVYLGNKNTSPGHDYDVIPVYEGVKQETLRVNEGEAFEPLDMPDNQLMEIIIQEVDTR